MTISKTWKRLLITGILVGIIAGSWAVWYVFYKPHRNVGNEKAAYEMTADALTKAFATDTAAVSKYIDKAILVEGNIANIEGSHIAMGNIICNMDSTALPELTRLKAGDKVKVQGRLTTYNDLMEEILMDQCVIK